MLLTGRESGAAYPSGDTAWPERRTRLQATWRRAARHRGRAPLRPRATSAACAGASSIPHGRSSASARSTLRIAEKNLHAQISNTLLAAEQRKGENTGPEVCWNLQSIRRWPKKISLYSHLRIKMGKKKKKKTFLKRGSFFRFLSLSPPERAAQESAPRSVRSLIGVNGVSRRGMFIRVLCSVSPGPCFNGIGPGPSMSCKSAPPWIRSANATNYV